MANNAYMKQPAIYNDTVVFVTDDDLWSVSKFGGKARRLTTDKGMCSSPKISPDGQWIAYLSNHHGQNDIYKIPLEGGVPERLTFIGVIGLSTWKDNSTLVFSSYNENFSMRHHSLYELNFKTQKLKDLNLGHARFLEFNGKKRVLGRNIGDPARWKRYRGGTAGTLWVDELGKGDFKQILKKLPTNLAAPKWINERIFFISDHEGVGNIYSCNSKGTGVKRHSHCEEYYVRDFNFHGSEIVFQAGAEIYLLDLDSDSEQRIDIDVRSTFTQALPRFESAESYLQEYDISNSASNISITTRGQIFTLAPWSKAPFAFGDVGKRYKHPTFMKNKAGVEVLLGVELNEENEETIKCFDLDTQEGKTLSGKTDWGKIYALTPSPKGNKVVITNNRAELFLLDINTSRSEKVATSPHHFFGKVSWSPCGNFFAYEGPFDELRQGIWLYDLKKKSAKSLMTPVLYDGTPAFDPSGKYLYFLSVREFHPCYNETHFEIGFPFASKVYGVALNKGTPSALDLHLEYEQEKEDEDEEEEDNKKKSSKKKTKKEPITEIDLDGIENRIFALPGALGGYSNVWAGKDKVFFLKSTISGSSPYGEKWGGGDPSTLYCFDLKEKKRETWQKGCYSVAKSGNGKHMALYTDDGIRIVSADGKPGDGDGYNKKDGYVDLERVTLSIDPKEEWKQMYQEAWILQREHFWVEDMSKIDWQKVYTRYLPLVDKVHTRLELSDVMWEMQGELGTSHCYEFMGDYHKIPPSHHTGSLAAHLEYNPRKKAMEIKSFAKGDSWINSARSPLRAPGIGLEVGDTIYSIDGFELLHDQAEFEALENKANKKVNLVVQRKGKKEKETLTVKTMSVSTLSHYRDWVEKNKEYVHKKSKGKLGYVHIPNMSVWGFSEFYRHFLSECRYEGLVVDVRYNGGGNVSQHLLKILAQNVIGFDQTRYFGAEPYPMYAINGPIVCVTNEHAGSDGDIFSHSFKLMGIGKLVGKRTWGGVIGIWPRQSLIDGTMTTQPEFSFWFKDVGYDVENYGTDPDYEVDITPKDYAMGRDPQLDKAIEVAQKETKKHPPLKPNLKKDRPNLKAPRLPKA